MNLQNEIGVLDKDEISLERPINGKHINKRKENMSEISSEEYVKKVKELEKERKLNQ